MRQLLWIFKGLAVTVLLVSLASCCCLGGTDDNEEFNPNPHNEGVGGDA